MSLKGIVHVYSLFISHFIFTIISDINYYFLLYTFNH